MNGSRPRTCQGSVGPGRHVRKRRRRFTKLRGDAGVVSKGSRPTTCPGAVRHWRHVQSRPRRVTKLQEGVGVVSQVSRPRTCPGAKCSWLNALVVLPRPKKACPKAQRRRWFGIKRQPTKERPTRRSCLELSTKKSKVPKSTARALTWYRKAAAQGHKESLGRVANL